MTETLEIAYGRDRDDYPKTNCLLWWFTDLHLKLGRHLSKIGRPCIDNPESQSEGESDIDILNENSVYDGWIRLGYLENEYLSG